MSQNQAIANYQHMRFIMNIPSNNINIVGNRGIVNINSTLEKVAQSIEGTSSISAEKRQKLLTLFEQLRIILVNTPASHAEDAGVVADQAKEISEELMRPQLRASMLKIKGTGLIEAAKTIAIVLPAAIGVAKQIAEFISNLPG
jgi:hypothetical protein